MPGATRSFFAANMHLRLERRASAAGEVGLFEGDGGAKGGARADFPTGREWSTYLLTAMIRPLAGAR
jgi:hypothetical protein